MDYHIKKNTTFSWCFLMTFFIYLRAAERMLAAINAAGVPSGLRHRSSARHNSVIIFWRTDGIVNC